MKATWAAVFCLIILNSAHARDITYMQIQEQAVIHSYDLKAGRLEEAISKDKLVEARAIYFPDLSMRFNNEYIHGFGNENDNTISVGDTVISADESTYQHSLSLSAQYLLYDFGIRELKISNAERDIALVKYGLAQQAVDLKIQVLSLYARGLELQKKITALNSILNLRNRIYQFTSRLVVSGSKDRLELGNTAIAVAETLQSRETLQLEMISIVENLNNCTGKNYDPATVQFSDLPDHKKFKENVDVTKLPDIKSYDIAIEQKKSEIEIARLHWMPSLSLYGSCRMYGKERSSFTASVENLEEKNAVIGLVVNMNLFKGFSDTAKISRLKKELQKLKIEREKQVAEHQATLKSLIQKAAFDELNQVHATQFNCVLNDQKNMGKRLADQQVIDRIVLLEQKEMQIEKQLSLLIASVRRCSDRLRLQILAEGTL